MQTDPAFLFVALLALTTTSCSQPGCTDYRASNYCIAADKNDGSCEYIGCTDESAFNYNPHALDSGLCVYAGTLRIFTNRLLRGSTYMEIVIDGSQAGILLQNCPQLLSCETACASVTLENVAPFDHVVQAQVLRPGPNGRLDTVAIVGPDTVFVPSGGCATVSL